MRATPDAELSALWLPLLRELSEASPRWGIWKNVDSALSGSGDMDSTAPKSDWELIESRFADWARSSGLDHVLCCRHVPGVLFLVAIDRSRRLIYELDVNARKYFRGWTMFRPDDLAPVMEMDDRGFRRIRPGAEALILFTQNGIRWGGRANLEGLRRKDVATKLREDPEGVGQAARLFGWARGATVRAARAASNGGWDRRAVLQMELRGVAGALAEPHIALTRVWSRHIKTMCPVLRLIFLHDRRLPDDIDRWLEVASRYHLVWGGK